MQGPPAPDEGGYLPQYPTQDPSQQPQFGVPPQPSPTQPSGLTLGDAAGIPPPETASDTYINRYLQTVDALGRQFAQYKRPLMHDPPGPNLLESLGTFGLANLKHMADVANTREENYRREHQNMAIDEHVNDLATKMTDANAIGSLQNQRLAIANQQLMLRLMEVDHNFRKDALNEGRNRVNFENKTQRIPIPTDPNKARYLHAAGWTESTDFPGFMEKTGGDAGGGGGPPGQLTKNPDGTWGMGNAKIPAHAPAARELNAVGGGDSGDTGAAGTAATPPKRLPNEPPEDYAQRVDRWNKAQEKLDVPTTRTRQMIEQAPHVLAQVDEVEKNLQTVTGWLNARKRGLRTGFGLPDPAFRRYQASVTVLTGILAKMHSGGQGGQRYIDHFTDILNAGRDDPSNMQASLDEIRKYTQELAKPPSTSSSSTTETTTSTTPPSTAGSTQPTQPTGTAGMTPGGIKYRVLP